jgi:hypothetical protein
VDATFRNQHAIPTRTARAAERRIGRPDAFVLEAADGGEVEVLAGGVRGDRFRPEELELAERDPARVLSEQGIDGRDEVRVRWFVRGAGQVRVRWEGDKGRPAGRTAALDG